MQHVEGALALGDVDSKALASLPVGDGDDHAIVALAPEQPEVDAVVRAVVELAEVIGDDAEKVPARPRRGNTGAPANRRGVVPTYLPWLARRLRGCAGQFMPMRIPGRIAVLGGKPSMATRANTRTALDFPPFVCTFREGDASLTAEMVG